MTTDKETPADAVRASYENHVELERGAFKHDDDGELKLPSCYVASDTVDAWRHRRMCQFVEPLIADDSEATWITIGDGRFGSDAYLLSEMGCDVTATSLTDESLRIAKERGLIKKFRSINAEQIDMADDSVDYVFCKESYHHFPRPPVAFYEMLRVARKGVILLEPQRTRVRPLDRLKRLIKKMVRSDGIDLFEPVGNYIYRVNVPQIVDMMLSLNMTTISYQYFNDFWHPRLSSGAAESGRMSWRLTLLGIKAQDLLSRLRLIDYGLVAVVVFKTTPCPELVEKLGQRGYETDTLPRNPFLNVG